MIEDRKYRQQLIEAYLDAETTVEQETALAQWFAAHTPDADEAAAAALILADYPQAAILSDEGVKEFDNAVAHSRRAPARRIWLAAASLAAAVALFFILRPALHGAQPEFTPMEIAQNINTIMSLDAEEIESILAEPKGAKVILTAKMKDGSSSTFVMSRDLEDGSTLITAQNKTNKRK